MVPACSLGLMAGRTQKNGTKTGGFKGGEYLQGREIKKERNERRKQRQTGVETVREGRSKGSESKGKIKNKRVGQRNHYLKGISGQERAEIRQATGIKLRTTASLL